MFFFYSNLTASLNSRILACNWSIFCERSQEIHNYHADFSCLSPCVYQQSVVICFPNKAKQYDRNSHCVCSCNLALNEMSNTPLLQNVQVLCSMATRWRDFTPKLCSVFLPGMGPDSCPYIRPNFSLVFLWSIQWLASISNSARS